MEEKKEDEIDGDDDEEIIAEKEEAIENEAEGDRERKRGERIITMQGRLKEKGKRRPVDGESLDTWKGRQATKHGNIEKAGNSSSGASVTNNGGEQNTNERRLNNFNSLKR